MERYPRLRDLREDADLTQAQVGQALHLTQRAYAYYESGQRMLPPQVLCALARYYGVSVDYLLGETDVRALSGGEKAVRDRSAPPETAGFSKPCQPSHPAPPRKKAAAPVGAAVFPLRVTADGCRRPCTLPALQSARAGRAERTAA